MSATPIKIQIRGVGHIPAFKNKKRMRVDWENAKVHQFTRKDIKLLMEKIIHAIESQLFSASPTTEFGTRTVHSVRSWIVLSLPLDDSTKWVRQEYIEAEDVPKGEEGADIIIEQI